jgi:hypothetical protein
MYRKQEVLREHSRRIGQRGLHDERDTRETIEEKRKILQYRHVRNDRLDEVQELYL